jgi:molecular chaperone DnaK
LTAIGIDLGTTNSCAAVWRNGKLSVINDAEGYPVTPSVVSVRENGETIAGRRAARDAEINPLHCYRAVKRLIGRRFEDEQVRLTQEVSAFEIQPAENGEAWIQGRERLHAPAEIANHVLRRMKASAELTLGKKIEKAVITVPAFFNDAQRKATLAAGEIAGLKVLRIINEPTAAALALELDRDGPATIAMYDLGGGTFDLSILRVDDKGEIEVLCTNGDTFLGGEDFDRRLLDHIADDFFEQHGVDPRGDMLARARLKLAVEELKCELSSVEAGEISLAPFMVIGAERRPVSLLAKVTRETLERLTADLIARTIALCRAALEESGLDVAAIDRVVLVGGQTRMPAVQAAVKAFFGRAVMMAPDPDQIVARGAAVMAAALTGQLAVELEDVTPFALGVETADGRQINLIDAQAKIPARATRAFTTEADAQDGVTIRLRQGSSADPRENLALGRFDLDGVKPKDGRSIVDVTADIDADGVMTAAARCRGSGRVQTLTVETMGLSPRAIERLGKLGAKAERAAKQGDAAHAP